MEMTNGAPRPVRNPDGDDNRYLLRLYIAGQSARSVRAVENLQHIVAKYMPDADVEVIDVYQQRELAKEMNLIGAPTLEKRFPLPLKRILGDLSDEDRVVLGLDLATEEA